MEVSIIIVNYNTKALTEQCLESVFEKTQCIEFEVIVVDNASQDGSRQMLKEAFPQVRLIESPENIGFGRANNLSAKYASGKYLFLLNSDTILMNNVVKILSGYLNEHQDVGVCGGNLFNDKQEPNASYMLVFPSFRSMINDVFAGFPLKLFYGKNGFFNHTGKPMNVAYIIGADMMIRKDVFDKQNGFDTDFFMYFEEAELQWRISKAGYKRICVPDACIIHLDGKSWSLNTEKNRNRGRAYLLYFKEDTK